LNIPFNKIKSIRRMLGMTEEVAREGGGDLRNKGKSRNRKSKRRTITQNKGKRKKTGRSKRSKRSKGRSKRKRRKRSKRRNSRRMKRRSRKYSH